MKRFICEWLSFFLLCIARFCDAVAFDLARIVAKNYEPLLPERPRGTVNCRCVVKTE